MWCRIRRASPSETIPAPSFASIRWSRKDNDEYKKLLAGAKSLAEKGTVVRGVPVTEELYDLILFTVHSFVRPMTTELYALKHNDITLADEPKRLLVTVRNGKTGMRIANTLEGAVAPYKRLCQRYPDATGEDYLFLPHYENRATAARVFARQFNALLEETRAEDGCRSSNPADDLQPTPYRDLHEDHSLAGQSEHLQPRQERRHQR